MFMRISLSIFAPTYLLYRVLYCFVPLYFVLSFCVSTTYYYGALI